MVFGDVTNKLLSQCVENIQKPENRTRIQEYVLTPVAKYIEGYLKPYFLTLLLCLLAIIFLLSYNIRLMYKVLNRE